MTYQLLRLATLALATFGATAHADIYTVGSGSGCTHASIPAAIAAAQSHAGADTVRIARGTSYLNVHLNIDTTQELTLEGGYSSCTQTAPDASGNTVLSASHTQGAVLHVVAGTGGVVRVKRLELRDAANDSFGGGGIYFEGDGILDVSDSLITANRANNGGGIYAHGTGGHAELVIGANVVIGNNIANTDGGGIYADQVEMTMIDPGSILMANKAPNGHGGGLYVRAGSLNGYAYVGSSGVAGVGAIWGNSAKYGGGIAVGGSNGSHGTTRSAELRLFSTDPQNRPDHRVRISGNTASAAGGAIHVQSSDGGLTNGEVQAQAKLWNTVLEDNSAPKGAVAYLDGGSYSAFLFNEDSPTTPWPAGVPRCPVASDCGRIVGNVATNDSGNATDGAMFEEAGNGYALFRLGCILDGCALPTGGIVIEGNRGGRLADVRPISFKNALIDGNQFTKQLIRASSLRLIDATLAGNTVGIHPFLSTSTYTEIKRSLLWQPGLITLQHSGTMVVDHVMASEIDSLGGNFGGGGDCGGGVCAILADPMFVDPAHGDYTLRAASPAIDMAPAIAGDDRDVVGRTRDYDLPHTWADNGPRDLGAFERHWLSPLVLNGNFDPHDLRLWTVFAGEWNGTENVVGDYGSGAWRLQKDVTPPIGGLSLPDAPTSGDYPAGEQCIVLPGPGRYLLSGWGKAAGNFAFHDAAVLAWEYRKNSTFDCGGTVDASGELTLSTSSSWARPTHPAVIDSTEADFYASNPTIKLRLIGRSGFPAGLMTVWFDGITLDVTEFDDEIFANGFD